MPNPPLLLTLLSCIKTSPCAPYTPDGLRVATDAKQTQIIKQCFSEYVETQNDQMLIASFDSMEPSTYWANRDKIRSILVGDYSQTVKWTALMAAREANDRPMIESIWNFTGKKMYSDPTKCGFNLGCSAYFALQSPDE